jgi:rRNA maturation endonuclease Nob1
MQHFPQLGMICRSAQLPVVPTTTHTERTQMKLEYICCECGREISSSQYEELSENFCPDCGGYIEKNTKKTLTKAVTLAAIEPTAAVFEENTKKTLLITCESCSRQFSKRAKECPKCGWQPQVICQICQQKIPFDSTVCPECGDPGPFQTQQTIKTEDFPRKDLVNITTQKQVAGKKLGTKWLSFWNYYSLPVGGVLGILMSIGTPAIAIIMVPISILQIVTAIGLHYRKNWAWQANWVVILVCWLLNATSSNIHQLIQNGATRQLFFVFALLMLFQAVVWIWPNYVYWNKRKHLFSD